MKRRISVRMVSGPDAGCGRRFRGCWVVALHMLAVAEVEGVSTDHRNLGSR